ncbi:MAG: hypothetical protein M1829_003941 [Trizodia sp. TS-e1964]|nr:MAG: hypothetical protein M1829_003941 [Trizodia sp. TS-e1964]
MIPNPLLSSRPRIGASEAPHTPARPSSHLYSLSGLRSEEELLVFEFGARWLRAGPADESSPRCQIGFGPEQQRREGDYRQWMVGRELGPNKRRCSRDWGATHELWRMDLREVNLGLIEDKVERAVREAFSNASITIFSPATLTTLAAGLRSALVIDIGWAETVVTGIFEYREIICNRSQRAGKGLSREMGRTLALQLRKSRGLETADNSQMTDREILDEISFEECEEVLVRMGWSKSFKEARTERPPLQPRKSQGPLSWIGLSKADLEQSTTDPVMSIPLQSPNTPATLKLPFSTFAEPIDSVLFVGDDAAHDALDDHELSVHMLAYRTLLSLPIDIRKECLPRIIITGGTSNIPGLKERIIDEISALIKERSWNNVRQRGLIVTLGEINKVPAERGLRCVESLGPWAGGSLAASLKIKSLVEIEKDKFMQHGLAGVSRDEIRHSLGTRTGVGERSSWTLGLWG